MFLRAENNNEIVNLSKVTYIHPMINEKTEKYFIYFVFDSMNNDEVNEIKWQLHSAEQVHNILEGIGIVDIESNHTNKEREDEK
ncbi:MAG: hypothetical protein GY787_27995 [Alteromonadales bacterium]|nr:hypothetical protein [Alteromonadales bacterium]